MRASGRGSRGSLFFWLWVYNKIIDKITCL
jgi:hypothetical protein